MQINQFLYNINITNNKIKEYFLLTLPDNYIISI